jgi:two-component system, LytTR family, response regulator
MIPPPADASLLRVVIVDDEAPARRGLRRLLEAESDVRIVQECLAGIEAVATIEAERPDAVFLDVQMPELDGFDVVRALRGSATPLIVFVTAFDKHAPAAFDAAAVDYLLKPVTAARVRTAVGRIRQRVLERNSLLARPADDPYRSPPPPEYLGVKLGARVELIPTSQIDWLEADGDYVLAHVGARSHLVSETLTSLLARLHPGTFMRIHRARAVNLARIRTLRRGPHGEYIINLAEGDPITAGRSYTAALNERFATTRNPHRFPRRDLLST